MLEAVILEDRKAGHLLRAYALVISSDVEDFRISQSHKTRSVAVSGYDVLVACLLDFPSRLIVSNFSAQPLSTTYSDIRKFLRRLLDPSPPNPETSLGEPAEVHGSPVPARGPEENRRYDTGKLVDCITHLKINTRSALQVVAAESLDIGIELGRLQGEISNMPQ